MQRFSPEKRRREPPYRGLSPAHQTLLLRPAPEIRPIESDANGAFTLDSLIPGLPFELTFRHGRRNFERIVKSPQAIIEAQSGACRDVGAIKLKPAPEKASE